MADGRERVAIWRWLDDESGIEHIRMTEGEQAQELSGTVAGTSRGNPWRIVYQVRCDAAWRTRAVRIEADAGTSRQTLSLDVDDEGRWSTGDGELEHLRGCVDVDFVVTPSTNTLPIRRLKLDVHHSGLIDVAWIDFPSLQVQRVAQRYTRVAPRAYRFENLPTAFEAIISVDDRGLVTSYPGGWEQVAVAG